MLNIERLVEDAPKKISNFKLPIFYQIQLISVFMIISLAILGFTILNIINTMKQTTNQMMARDNSLLENVINSKSRFQEIKTQYLLAIAGLSAGPTESNVQAVIDMMSVFKVVDETVVNDISKQLDSVRKILRSPPSREGYTRLNNLAFEYNIILNAIQRKIGESSEQIVVNNENYSTYAKIIVFVILIASGIISVFLGFLIAGALSRSLKRIGKATKALAIGDLTQKAEPQGCPEVKAVAVELNNAVTGLKHLVLAIDNQSRQIVGSSNFFRALSAESKSSALQIAKAMEELAGSSNEQAHQTDRVMQTIRNLIQLVERVGREIQNISNATERIAQSAQLGQQSTEIVTVAFNDLSESTSETATAIHELSNTSREISEITSVINTIAEQITLLALNASIEAARAGEHGKGFDVVASETRKLADQSKEAARHIAELIEQMNVRTRNVVFVTQKEKTRINAGKESVFSVNNNFINIFKAIMDNIAQINAVAGWASLMTEQNTATIEAITSIAAITEENLASVEEISATSEEQSVSMSKVSSSADNLNRIAEQLNESIAVFQL
jgi:methyl-accepting chemotaxis protein